MNEKTCEKCGCEMKKIEDELSVGMECPSCGWGWVTTDISSILLDETEYSVVLDINDSSIKNIKVISDIANCNFVKAKSIMESEFRTIYRGRATDIKDIKEILDGSKIKYHIEPDYNY